MRLFFAAAITVALLMTGPVLAGNEQSLFVFDATNNAYARYRLPDLSLLEAISTTGAGSDVAFNASGTAVDYTTNGSGGSIYWFRRQHVKFNVACPVQSPQSIATAPSGVVYVAEYCNNTVVEFRANGKMLGAFSVNGPTAVALDRAGNLYVGEAGGGIAYFAAGSHQAVGIPSDSGEIYGLAVDANDGVRSTGRSGQVLGFLNTMTCTPGPYGKGPITRARLGNYYYHGEFVHGIYSLPQTFANYASSGESIAVDSTGRMYMGLADPYYGEGAVYDYDPDQYCPDVHLTIPSTAAELPQVAVDGRNRLYVSSYTANTITVYRGGTTVPVASIAQPNGLSGITNMSIGP